jgi:GH25 family lysozyme M1 (1,4-beta-N-acetylmuramidase)
MIVFDFRYCVPPYPEYVDGIAIKLTQGKTFVNSLAQRQAAAGNVVAHWHYWEPFVDPVIQAQHYLDVAKDFEGHLFLDAEHPGAAIRGVTPIQLQKFVVEVEQKSGKPCGIYTRRSWWSYFAGLTSWAGSHPLWVAHYGAAHPAVPNEWLGKPYMGWQFQGDVYWPGWLDVTVGRAGKVDVDHWVPSPS